MIKTKINILDGLLQKYRHNYYLELNPPLVLSEILKLESKYQIKIPAELKQVYLWKNGQKNSCSEAFVRNQMFTPLEDVLETHQLLTGMIGYDFEIENWWNKNWLPIFHNGGGSHICYDVKGVFTGSKGQIIEYWKADYDRNVIFDNLSQFFEQIIDYYKVNDSSKYDGYFKVNLTAGFPKRFSVR